MNDEDSLEELKARAEQAALDLLQSEDDEFDEEEFSGEVWAAYEEACGAITKLLDAIEAEEE